MRPDFKRNIEVQVTIPFVLIYSILIAGSSAWGDVAPAEAPRVLILLAPQRPYVLTIRSEIDGKPLTASKTQWIAKLRSLLDQNQDGSISSEEWKGLLTWGERPWSASEAERLFRASDQHPQDGQLNPEELETLVSQIRGDPFRVEFPPDRQTQMADLFRLLDQDGDRSVSFEEIADGSRTLNRFDLNEDGSVAIEELVPPGTASNSSQAAGRGAAAMWIIVEPSQASVEAATKTVFAHYDRQPVKRPDGALMAEELGLSGPEFQTLDLNHNGMLDRSEVSTWLAKPDGQLQLHLQLSSRAFRRPRVTVQSKVPEATVTARGTLAAVTLGGIPLEIGTRSLRITSDDARQFYRVRFRQVDLDKNGYLSQQEFLQLQLPNLSFEQLDRDRNGQLFGNELTAFLDQYLLWSEGVISVSIRNDSKSLMELLDRDEDRRLSHREFREGANRLAALDTNHDGKISPAELTSRETMTFEYNRSSLLEVADRALSNQAQLRSRTRRNLTGPIWFQRMDRNLDGDVTWKEFLGPRPTFERLDKNHDGVIDEQESLQDQADGK